MATQSHAKNIWALCRPRVSQRTVSQRHGGHNLMSYDVINDPREIMTFPQLKVISLLYEQFIDALGAGKTDISDRCVCMSELSTNRGVIKRLENVKFIKSLGSLGYAITEKGADSYEFQWHVSNKMRHKNKAEKPRAMPSEKHGNRAFTDEQIANIRGSSGGSNAELAELYGCSEATIWRVRQYLTYKNVT